MDKEQPKPFVLTADTELVFFGEHKIELMREVLRHPDLVAKLAGYAPDDWPSQLAEITAHCNIVMDGWYSQQQLEDDLYPRLIFKLNKMRSPIIMANDPLILGEQDYATQPSYTQKQEDAQIQQIEVPSASKDASANSSSSNSKDTTKGTDK